MSLYVNEIPIKPIPADLLDSDPPRRFRMSWPSGKFVEFEARFGDLAWGEANNLWVHPSIAVRHGSIYDREGAD